MISAIISAGNISIDANDQTGHTALHHACIIGNHDAVTSLLQAGANPNARDADDLTPLYVS